MYNYYQNAKRPLQQLLSVIQPLYCCCEIDPQSFISTLLLNLPYYLGRVFKL